MPMQLLEALLAHVVYSTDIRREYRRQTLRNVWQKACGTDQASEGPFTPAASSSCSSCFSEATHEMLQCKGFSAPFAEPKWIGKRKKKEEKRVGGG